MQEKLKYRAVTFDDVLLEPRYSEVVPAEVRCRHAAHQANPAEHPPAQLPHGYGHRESTWRSPWLRRGASACIHKNMSIERQAEEVEKVKRSANGIICNPATLPARRHAWHTPARSWTSTTSRACPSPTADGRLVGILTRRDLRFLENWDLPISEVMTRENLVTARGL